MRELTDIQKSVLGELFKATGTVRLDTLEMDEISGVDAGANLIDGWMVLKARHAETGRFVPEGHPRVKPEAGIFRRATPAQRRFGGRFFS